MTVDTVDLVLVEALQKDGTEMVGTGTGDGLDRSNTLLCNRGRIVAEDELGSSTGEFGQTGDGEVLVVDRLVCDEIRLRLFYRGQNVGLAVVVTVCANTEVDFLIVGIGFVGRGQLENAVVRRMREEGGQQRTRDGQERERDERIYLRILRSLWDGAPNSES